LRQRILLIILGVLILLAFYTFFIQKPSSRVGPTIAKSKAKIEEQVGTVKEQVKAPVKEITKTVTEPVKSVVGAVVSKPESVSVEPEAEKSKWGTDPFVRDWMLSAEIKDLKLKAITQSGTKAYALINDQILEVGEIIAGKRIVSIEKDKVILEQGDRTFTLLLGQ
jgi:hypothetical protein